MVKVIVVEDHEIFRKGVITLLEDIKDIQVIGQAENGEAFIKLIERIKPDVVFMDVRMPVMDGIAATKKGLQIVPSMKVIALSMHSEEEYLEQMLEAGAMGFLLKNVSMTDIEKAIHTVLSGNRFFSEELMNILASKFIKKPETTTSESIVFSGREHDILKLICEGYTNVEIGEKLFISNRTVDGHRAKMLSKIGAVNTVGLVIYAIKNKLVSI
ncbi:MAG: hypothetical protein A2W91_05915 [Bacteroidetes bacterium GWF2_38_335]|nr:MAG: hypothetical protein A2W91_05915 [Bacteroidetes bacterium GWF2_38_335]OFY81611.1 MAG: hypothetical protein A2281_11710 [Bacteroidetes bacterium RIFOXYA12_FULL_38_20]HBS88962.1 DNA-binding response regulator [Bacteroidales bacterium]